MDVIGDRWTLLIVRELLIAPRRYSDLKAALPGIASNLLSSRVRAMENAGLVRMHHFPPPRPSRVYELTPLGLELETAVLALVRWGSHWMVRGPGSDYFRPEWLVVALKALIGPNVTARAGRVNACFDVAGESILLRVHGGVLDVRLGDDAADVFVRTDPETLLAVASGVCSFDEALASRRAAAEGRPDVVNRLVRLLNGPAR